MKSLLLAASGLALAATAAADIVTYTSTLVSSTCLLLQPYYGNSTSTEGDTIIYETEEVTAQDTITFVKTVCNAGSCHVTTELDSLTTVVTTVDGVLTTYVTAVPIAENSVVTETHIESTVVTITSCSNNKCHATAVTTGLTTVTDVVEGVTTVYTTYCPLSTEAEDTTTVQKTTVITVTSCDENKCSGVPVTTGVTEITTTIAGEETIYTTFCPLTSTTEAAGTPAETTVKTKPTVEVETTVKTKPAAETTSSTTTVEVETTFKTKPTSEVKPVTTVQKSDVETTVNVITNNIVTQSNTVAAESTAQSTPSAIVTSYEGSANRMLPALLGAVPAFFMLL